MENFFTKTPEEFERFTRKSENPFVPEGEGGKPKREAYRYAMVRSLSTIPTDLVEYSRLRVTSP